MSFVSPRTSNIKGRGEQNSLFPEGPVIKFFVISAQLKIKQTAHECNTLQFDEEPKIADTQLQKSTVINRVRRS